jgi:hypothetical protein
MDNVTRPLPQPELLSAAQSAILLLSLFDTWLSDLLASGFARSYDDSALLLREKDVVLSALQRRRGIAYTNHASSTAARQSRTSSLSSSSSSLPLAVFLTGRFSVGAMKDPFRVATVGV